VLRERWNGSRRFIGVALTGTVLLKLPVCVVASPYSVYIAPTAKREMEIPRKIVVHSQPSATSFDVFISYSRQDIDFARSLERTLESYKPAKDLSVPRRYLQVFRDESDFTGVEYFQAVDEHLRKAGKLVVICSPGARGSKYVDDEIRRFANYRGADHIIPVLIAGIPNNELNADPGHEMAFPEALVEVLKMPRAIDYRGFDFHRNKLDREAFSASWYSLLAEIYGLSRDVIEQRERKRRIRRRRIVVGVVASVLAMLSTALIWALTSRQEAIRQRNIALARQLAAQGDLILQNEPHLLERAALLGAESLHRLQTPEGDQVVRAAVDLVPQPVMDISFPNRVVTAALAPDGEHVVVAGESGVDLFNCISKQRLAHISDDGVVFAVAISPDGKWLLTGDNKGKINIFDMPSGRPYKQLQVEGPVTNIVFTSDGAYFAARSMSSTVNIWAAADASGVAALTHGGIVQSISFARDGRKLCAGTQNGLVDLWDLSSRRVLRQMNAEGRVRSIACGISGQVVAATGKREVRVWGATPAENFVLQDQHAVTMVLFSRDERYLATVGENRAEVLDAHSWTPVARLAHQGDIEALVFHPQQFIVATASDDRTARVWDLRSGSEIARIAHQEPVLDANFDGSGHYLVTASVDQSARVVEIKTDSGLPWETGKPTAVVFGATRYVATGDIEGVLRVWDRQTRDPVRAISAFNKDEITALCLSPDERHVAAATRSGAVSVWDVTTGVPLFAGTHGAKINAIAIQADKGTTFTGGDDGKVKIWSSAGQLEATQSLADPVTDLAVSSDGKSLAVAIGRLGQKTHGAAVLLNRDTGEVLRQIEDSSSPVQAAAFSSDSRWLVTGGQDNMARLWDVKTGKEHAKFVHEHPVMAVALTVDARYVATGSTDHVTRIWETATGRELVRLAHPGPLKFVQFTPTGQRLLTASFDPSGVLLEAREWQWRAEDLIQQVCSRTATRLTPGDWTRYISVEPYSPVCPSNLH
jgi:WD40 repeat protein